MAPSSGWTKCWHRWALPSTPSPQCPNNGSNMGQERGFRWRLVCLFFFFFFYRYLLIFILQCSMRKGGLKGWTVYTLAAEGLLNPGATAELCCERNWGYKQTEKSSITWTHYCWHTSYQLLCWMRVGLECVYLKLFQFCILKCFHCCFWIILTLRMFSFFCCWKKQQ